MPDAKTMNTEEFGKLLTDGDGTIAHKLAHVDDAQLKTLRDLEAGGANRIALLDAIDGEMARRAEAGNGSGDAGVAGSGAGDVTGEPAVSQAQVDQMIADQAEGHKREIEALKADHAAELAKVKAAGKAGDGKAKAARHAKPMALPKDLADPGFAVASGPVQVTFVDADYVPLAGLTPLDFANEDFDTGHDGTATLTRKIDFPRDAPAGTVSAAILLADGKPAGIAHMVVPFAVCGGRGAEIPAKSLRFTAR